MGNAFARPPSLRQSYGGQASSSPPRVRPMADREAPILSIKDPASNIRELSARAPKARSSFVSFAIFCWLLINRSRARQSLSPPAWGDPDNPRLGLFLGCLCYLLLGRNYFGANDASNFSKRGSFRSGSNIGSSRSSAGVRGTFWLAIVAP